MTMLHERFELRQPAFSVIAAGQSADATPQLKHAHAPEHHLQSSRLYARVSVSRVRALHPNPLGLPATWPGVVGAHGVNAPPQDALVPVNFDQWVVEVGLWPTLKQEGVCMCGCAWSECRRQRREVETQEVEGSMQLDCFHSMQVHWKQP